MAGLSNSRTSVGERVRQFSPLLAVLFFCSSVCNRVNSWTPLLLTRPTHGLSVAPLSLLLSFSPLPSSILTVTSLGSLIFLRAKRHKKVHLARPELLLVPLSSSGGFCSFTIKVGF